MTTPAQPRRLGGRRVPLLAAGEADAGWSAMGKPAASLFGRLRVVRRLVLIVLWVLVCFPIQLLLVALPGRANEGSARMFWNGLLAILGLRLRMLGQPAHRTADGRPVVYVANHSSWLDIPVLGARLDAAFIAKEEIGTWPVVSWIARLGRTVYVRRVRASTVRERDEMRARLAAGDSLILFPEGTTSDGSHVLPFRSAFLSVAEIPVSPDGRSAIVQPVSLVYDRLGGLPVGRATRLVFAWPGDMDLASHFLRFARLQGFRATILLHPPVDPAAYGSRKALSEAVWRIVANGAAELRQNRDPAGNA